MKTYAKFVHKRSQCTQTSSCSVWFPSSRRSHEILSLSQIAKDDTKCCCSWLRKPPHSVHLSAQYSTLSLRLLHIFSFSTALSLRWFQIGSCGNMRGACPRFSTDRHLAGRSPLKCICFFAFPVMKGKCLPLPSAL